MYFNELCSGESKEMHASTLNHLEARCSGSELTLKPDSFGQWQAQLSGHQIDLGFTSCWPYVLRQLSHLAIVCSPLKWNGPSYPIGFDEASVSH